MDVLILGGGIIGAATAYDLARKGVRVRLLEKNHFGSGASGNSAAMLEFLLDAHRGEPFFTLSRLSHQLFPRWAEDLRSDSGIDIQFEECGILQLALDNRDAVALAAEAERLKKLGFNARWLASDAVKSEFPALQRTGFGGIFFGNDGQVNGERFLQACLAAARKHGAIVEQGIGDLSLVIKNNHSVAVRSRADEWLPEKIIVATGAWTDLVINPLGLRLGVEPVRGQLVIYDTPKRLLKSPVYTQRSGYLTPKQEGYTLGGTTVERVGFDSTATASAQSSINANVGFLLGDMSGFPVRGVTAGLRPRSPDELPILGPLPSHPNVLVAAGHYRNGILLAPISAVILSALCAGEAPPLPLDPFSPRRFLPSAS